MKKILLGALVSTVFAGSALAEAPCSAFNGFYLGAGLNYMQENFKFNGNLSGPGISGSASGSTSINGGGVKIFGGYGALISQGFYLGGELSFGFDRIIGSSKKNDLDANKKINYGIAARAGYAFSNVLPYVKFGYEGRPSVKAFNLVNIRRNGFILGGGLDVAVNKNVFIRGEYVHGFGAKSNYSASANGYTGNVNFKTSSDTFMLGAAYKF